MTTGWNAGDERDHQHLRRLVEEFHLDDPIPCFEVKENALGRVKNETSRRLVPIASELIRLGFLDYVRDLEALEPAVS